MSDVSAKGIGIASATKKLAKIEKIVLEIFSDILFGLREIFCILRESDHPGPAVELKIKFGSVIMSESLNVGQKVPFFITGTDASGARTSQLAAGASLKALADNPAVGTIAQDATPQPAPDGGPSIVSGTFTAVGVGSENLSAAVTNADGTAGPQDTEAVVVAAAAPGPATSVVIVFGKAQ